MNHQPFEDWLFVSDDEPEDMLTSQQTDRLNEHLQTCESCNQLADAWSKVEVQLQEAPMVAPLPGFTSRWQARLEADRRKVHQRQTVGVIVLGVIAVLILLATLVYFTLPWMRSPNVLIWAWLYRMFTMAAYVDGARELLMAVLRSTSSIIPSLTWWILSVGLITELGVLWIVSYRLLTNPRRILR